MSEADTIREALEQADEAGIHFGGGQPYSVALAVLTALERRAEQAERALMLLNDDRDRAELRARAEQAEAERDKLAGSLQRVSRSIGWFAADEDLENGTPLEQAEARAEQAEAALREARELLVMERSWAGCFCAVQNPDGTHDADCTWPAWLARYESFLAATTPGEPCQHLRIGDDDRCAGCGLQFDAIATIDLSATTPGEPEGNEP